MREFPFNFSNYLLHLSLGQLKVQFSVKPAEIEAGLFSDLSAQSKVGIDLHSTHVTS